MAAATRYVPSIDRVPLNIQLADSFVEKHGSCAKVLQMASARPRSKWQVHVGAVTTSRARRLHVDSLGDVCGVITRARRVLRGTGGLQGTLIPMTAASSPCIAVRDNGRGEHAAQASAVGVRLVSCSTEGSGGSALRKLFAT